MFLPIVAQKRSLLLGEAKRKEDSKWHADAAAAETERLLFDVTKRRTWRFNAALKKASIDNSPLALAFARGKKRAAEAEAERD
jgi:hypothetical protein